MRTIERTNQFKRDYKREAKGQHRQVLTTDFHPRAENLSCQHCHTQIRIQLFPMQPDTQRQFQTLLDFSLGRIDDVHAMKLLGIDGQEDLFLLMARAHLPMPRLSADATEAMAQSLHALAR